MKKIILSVVLCAGVLLSVANGSTVQAADILEGNTEVAAEVIGGEVTLTVNEMLEFPERPLSETVDFGSRLLSVMVTDYSGTTNGFEVSAKLTDTDQNRTLKVGNAELSNTSAPVLTQSENVVGENGMDFNVRLVYTGVTEVRVYTSTIEWNLSKTTTKQISE